MSAAIVHGSVERVTYHNAENGFCVLKVAVKNKREAITVIGRAAQVMAGEDIEAIGVWLHDRNHGLQLKAESIKMTVPTSLEGMKKYLASGLIKGVGKHFAQILVNAFHEQVFTVLDTEPQRVQGLPGIGQKRSAQIIAAWQEQRVIREVMLFLHSHGLGTARAVRIYKTYGDDTIGKLQANPYRLALDIWGIGFKTADQLAQSIGIAQNSVLRAEAGIRQVLNEFSNQGHCAIAPDTLVAQSIAMLAIEPEVIEEALSNELANGNIIQERINEQTYLYLAPLYYAEQGIATNLQRLLHGSSPQQLSDSQIMALAEHGAGIDFSPSQKIALLMAVKHKVSIITGGPGVGKTTLVKSILKIISQLGKTITLCAPTGRAARRLSESSGHAAKTIHRLLEYRPGQGARFKADFPLSTDFIIIDETSMVDVALMNTLLKAIPTHASVLFVGDIDQLPSVGPGCVLSDMINSTVIVTTRLTEIFRQAQTSKIITNAHRINQGFMPYYSNKRGDDFFFIEVDEPEALIERLLTIVAVKLPELYQIDPKRDLQVLVPMNKGSLGVKNLNLVLQERLNPLPQLSVTCMGINFRCGDKVIQNMNNYDKDVFNGDIGYIQSMDISNDVIQVCYDERLVTYSRSELDELDLAYAISIHKSQGSEYPIVITPITMQHYTLLERNLLYTGVTRGKKMVILIGQKKALFMAVKRVSAEKRITGLVAKLQQLIN